MSGAGKNKLIGITGLIGSGKSLAARVFEQKGAKLIDADKVGHGVLRSNGTAYAEVLDRFGPGILGPDGEIDRKALGAVVFADTLKLEQLNDITHKWIIAEIEREIEAARALPDNNGVVVIEAIYLLESELAKRCDEIIVVAADEDVRIDRIVRRDGISSGQAKLRVDGQSLTGLFDPGKYTGVRVLYNNCDMDEFIKNTEVLAENVIRGAAD